MSKSFSVRFRQWQKALGKRFKEKCELEENVKPKVWLRILLAIIGGTCVFLSFPYHDVWILAYFALVPMLWSVHGTTPGKAFLLGMLAGFVTNLGGFNWIYDLMKDFGHIPEVPSFVLTLAFAALQGTLFGFWLYFVRKTKIATRYSALMALPALEFCFPMLFPWYIGNSQYLVLPAIQISDIFGILGISTLLVLVNLLLYELSKLAVARIRKVEFQLPTKFMGIGTAIVALVFIYGGIRIAQVDAIQESAPRLHVGMVEADIDIQDSSNPTLFRRNLILHHSLSEKLMDKNLDLLVWPESSYASNFIWGSMENSDDPVFLEADSIYTPKFRDRIMPALHLLNKAFEMPIYQSTAINQAFNEAVQSAALKNGFTLPPPGYPHTCERDENPYLRCPFIRVPHDKMTYYRPGFERVRGSERDDAAALSDAINALAIQRNLKVPIILGSVSIQARDGSLEGAREMIRQPANKRYLHNVALFLDENGKVIGSYKKIHLMPIGEYIPYGESFPIIYQIIKEAGTFTPGNEIQTFMFKGAKIAIIVCYEDILPRFVRKFSEQRPQIFVNVTNDAWFGKTKEPSQHMALSVIRSVEHHKWLVRSTNTGVSVFVDAVGRITKHTSIYDAEVLDEEVAIMPKDRSIYSYIGDILGWFSLFGVLFVWIFLRKPKSPKASKNAKEANDAAKQEKKDDSKADAEEKQDAEKVKPEKKAKQDADKGKTDEQDADEGKTGNS